MSRKTSFKRIALALVASLGIGLISASAPASAVIQGESVTLSSSTATAYINDSATVTMTHTFSGNNSFDSSTVMYSCAPATGATTCPAIMAAQTATADTLNVMVKKTSSGVHPEWQSIAPGATTQWSTNGGWTDSSTSTTNASRSVVSLKAMSFTVAGTYTYTFYTQSGGANATSELTPTSKVLLTAAATWTVTVSALSNNGDSLATLYISSDNHTAVQNRLAFRASSDSAIVAPAGNATALAIVGYAFITVANSAGDTRTKVSGAWQNANESVTVTITGAGLVSKAADPGTTASNYAPSVVLDVQNGSALTATETLTIASNGTAATATLTFTNRSNTVLATRTITFTGPAAAAYPYFGNSATNSDTVVSLSQTPTMYAVVKDAASTPNTLKAGTLYLYSSDTKIIGIARSSYTAQKVTTNTCTPATAGVSTVFTCAAAGLVLNGETGTATLVLRDSWTVAASSWASAGIDITVVDDEIASLTVAFDKATYAPGERAVITITGKAMGDRSLATSTSAAFTTVSSTGPALTSVQTAGIRGTASGDSVYSSTFTVLRDSGVETRVVTMPSVGGDVTYTITYTKWDAKAVPNSVASATVKVVDPVQDAQNALIAAAQAAAVAAANASKAEATAAIAAADAATDAALQAIDAANAATDAANLAAEAADAATVAAEEAKDAADAATAAVEALATQVATLMAALQAQVRSLANTVAKIAKKVKA